MWSGTPLAEEGKDDIMSTALIKNVSVSKAGNRLTVTAADSNSTPRRYERTVFDADDIAGLREHVADVGRALFDGVARFLPSSACKAHEAYIRANDAMGGDVENARRLGYVPGSREYDEYEDKWVDAFASFLIDGKRDTNEYVLLRDYAPVTVRMHTDECAHVTGYTYSFATSGRDNTPKLVPYTYARQATGLFPELAMRRM